MSILDGMFDIHAMTEPKTAADYSALLDEALAELSNIGRSLERVLATPSSEPGRGGNSV